ncbi:DNA cytosine methyltransferase [Escherichia coli]
MNELALFAGAGGGILGGYLLGWRTVCAVERDAYAAQVLAQRQNDGILRPFPIWSDVRSFDGKPWRGIVDVVSGGFPCQDISAAGKGAGIDGEKSGLWRHMARIISEVRPRFVLVENSPLLVRRGLAVVVGDLAEMGYDAQWCRLSALDAGAPHKRDRIWVVAQDVDNAISERREPGRLYTEKMTGTSLAQQVNTPSRIPSFAPQLDTVTGPLNPEWVEWLMGWPIGWTELKPLEMDKFREWQLQHSACCVEINNQERAA